MRNTIRSVSSIINNLSLCLPTKPCIESKEDLSNSLKIIRVIGKGTHGTVYLAMYKPSMKLVAVKRVECRSPIATTKIKNELQVLADICSFSQLYGGDQEHDIILESHSYTIQFFYSYPDPLTDAQCIVMEYMGGGSLNEAIVLGIQFTEDEIAIVAYSVLQSLTKLSRLHCIHRDVKPANILCDSIGNVKLADFGTARNVDFISSPMDEGYCNPGTLQFMSPQCIKSLPYSNKCDIWSLGVTLVQLMTGELPFAQSKGYWGLRKEICNATDIKLPADIYSANLVEFISQCFKKNECDRPSAVELLQSPFITSKIDIGLLPPTTTTSVVAHTPPRLTRIVSQIGTGYPDIEAAADILAGSASLPPSMMSSLSLPPPRSYPYARYISSVSTAGVASLATSNLNIANFELVNRSTTPILTCELSSQSCSSSSAVVDNMDRNTLSRFLNENDYSSKIENKQLAVSRLQLQHLSSPEQNEVHVWNNNSMSSSISVSSSSSQQSGSSSANTTSESKDGSTCTEKQSSFEECRSSSDIILNIFLMKQIETVAAQLGVDSHLLVSAVRKKIFSNRVSSQENITGNNEL